MSKVKVSHIHHCCGCMEKGQQKNEKWLKTKKKFWHVPKCYVHKNIQQFILSIIQNDAMNHKSPFCKNCVKK